MTCVKSHTLNSSNSNVPETKAKNMARLYYLFLWKGGHHDKFLYGDQNNEGKAFHIPETE